MLTLLAVALTVPAVAALVLATRRRLPPSALPATFAILMGEAIALVPVVQHDERIGAVVSGTGLAVAVIALAMAIATAESQLAPNWWNRFERDLRAYEALRSVG